MPPNAHVNAWLDITDRVRVAGATFEETVWPASNSTMLLQCCILFAILVRLGTS